MIPASMSLAQFPDWREAFADDNPLCEGPIPSGTLAIIIVGRSASEATIASLRQQLGPINLKVAILDTVGNPLEFERSRYAAACHGLAKHLPNGWLFVVRVRSCDRSPAQPSFVP